MTLQSLMIFIGIVWIMVLAAAAFLVILVPSVHLLFKAENRTEKSIVSLIQAVIAMAVVVLFIIGLSRLKRNYARRKLHL